MSNFLHRQKFEFKILPQTPVHLAQMLNSIFECGNFNQGTFTFNPNSMKISNWTTNLANQSHNDLDWPGFTRFVANTYQSRSTRFWGKILNSNYCLCKKIDISQLCPSLNVSFNTILSTDIYVVLEQELCLPSRSEYIRLITIILDLPSEYD